jgi:Spy/CpxP family protein refolding chaperone
MQGVERMRRSVLIIFLTGFLALTAAIAQNTPTPSAPHGYRAGGPERAFQQLNLTADQNSQIQQLMRDQRSQMQALRANTSLTPEQRKQQIHDLRAANHQKVMALLTPEQQTQFQQLQQQRRVRGRAFHNGRRMQGLQALNLTEQQKDQIKPIFQSTRQQMQALRNDTSLTPEQRREKLQQIRQSQQAQLNSILTPEQQQQLQQMHRRHNRQGNSVQPQGF